MLAPGLREPPEELSIPLFSGSLWSYLWGVDAMDAMGCCITGGNQGIAPKKDCRLAPFSVLLPVRPPASVQPLWASVGK